MFEEYKFIIIGVGVVLVLGIVAVVVMSKKKDTPKTEEKPETKQPVNEEKAKIIEEAKQVRIEEAKATRLQEQQNVEAKKEATPKVEEKKEISLVSTRLKREVPAHSKIVKENFEVFSNMRILVAEDNMINQKVIKGLLGGSGIELVMADDGQIALDILSKDSNFELVLMDAHMPNIDGFEASRQIRANESYNQIVIAALSGDTASDDIKKMINAGMQEQLEKPLRMDALYDVLYMYANTIVEKSQQEVQSATVTTQEVASTSQSLDTQKGLATCGGDKDFYVELLNEFASSYETSRDKLEKSLQENDLVSADKLLHEIVGVSGNIGATELYAHITIIRETIKAGDTKKCLTLTDKYEDLLMQVLEEIVDYQ